MSVRFAVRTDHPWSPRGWIWVVVHDSREQLQAAAARYSPEQDHSDTEATFQATPYSVEVDDDTGRVTRGAKAYAGILRILPEHGVATLAHEATHAAVALYGRQHARWLDAHGDIEDEEVLCYAVGDLVGQVTAELQRRGIWP